MEKLQNLDELGQPTDSPPDTPAPKDQKDEVFSNTQREYIEKAFEKGVNARIVPSMKNQSQFFENDENHEGFLGNGSENVSSGSSTRYTPRPFKGMRSRASSTETLASSEGEKKQEGEKDLVQELLEALLLLLETLLLELQRLIDRSTLYEIDCPKCVQEGVDDPKFVADTTTHLTAIKSLYIKYRQIKRHKLSHKLEKKTKHLLQRMMREAGLGDVLEVFYSDHHDLYASISPPAQFCALLDVDFIASRTPIFERMRCLFQGKNEREEWAEYARKIFFANSFTLFFSPLMLLKQIKALVDDMSVEDRAQVEIVAIREDIFFDKEGQDALDILARFDNLKKVLLVFEIASGEEGKECLGPQGKPVKVVEFYPLAAAVEIDLLTQTPFQIEIEATNKLEHWWETRFRTTAPPVGKAVAVKRNGIETIRNWLGLTKEQIKEMERAEAEKKEKLKRQEKDSEDFEWQDPDCVEDANEDEDFDHEEHIDMED